jgi:hypothetical protein
MNTIPESTIKIVIPASLQDRMSLPVLVSGEVRVKDVEG